MHNDFWMTVQITDKVHMINKFWVFFFKFKNFLKSRKKKFRQKLQKKNSQKHQQRGIKYVSAPFLMFLVILCSFSPPKSEYHMVLKTARVVVNPCSGISKKTEGHMALTCAPDHNAHKRKLVMTQQKICN